MAHRAEGNVHTYVVKPPDERKATLNIMASRYGGSSGHLEVKKYSEDMTISERMEKRRTSAFGSDGNLKPAARARVMSTDSSKDKDGGDAQPGDAPGAEQPVRQLSMAEILMQGAPDAPTISIGADGSVQRTAVVSVVEEEEEEVRPVEEITEKEKPRDIARLEDQGDGLTRMIAAEGEKVGSLLTQIDLLRTKLSGSKQLVGHTAREEDHLLKTMEKTRHRLEHRRNTDRVRLNEVQGANGVLRDEIDNSRKKRLRVENLLNRVGDQLDARRDEIRARHQDTDRLIDTELAVRGKQQEIERRLQVEEHTFETELNRLKVEIDQRSGRLQHAIAHSMAKSSSVVPLAGKDSPPGKDGKESPPSPSAGGGDDFMSSSFDAALREKLESERPEKLDAESLARMLEETKSRDVDHLLEEFQVSGVHVVGGWGLGVGLGLGLGLGVRG